MSDNKVTKEETNPTSLLLKEVEVRDKFIAEAFTLIYQAGLLDNMSQTAREFISEQGNIQEMITNGKQPSLEPRLTLKEYIQHIVNILEVPSSQHAFISYIVKVTYIMILSEKNPLVAQELRGVLNVNSMLKDIVEM